MAADALKSVGITNLDAIPTVPNTTGEGGPGYAKNITGYCTTTAVGLGNTSSKYKLVRLPSNAKVKALKLVADAALDTSTGLAIDVGAYYSDSTVDGTQPALQGTAIGVAAFASAITTFRSSALGPVEALGAYTTVMRDQPLWQALALATDPGGFIDIVAAVHTAATTAGSGNLGIECNYVE